MDCRAIDELLMKYMDGTLNSDEAVELNKHVAYCDKCKEEFMAYESMLKHFDIMDNNEEYLDYTFVQDVMEEIESLDINHRKNVFFDLVTNVACTVVTVMFVFIGIYTVAGEQIATLAQSVDNNLISSILNGYLLCMNGLESVFVYISQLNWTLFGTVYFVAATIALIAWGFVYFMNFHNVYDARHQKN
ncbi:MAG: anti-sigma factor family protein [Lachnospirales bacterium]